MLTTQPLSALSPVPFFRHVERVGVLCTVDAAPEAVPGAPEEAWLCSLAHAELAALLGAAGRPEVAVLSRNDERIADPATLVVLLHANTRLQDPGGTVTALAASLYRSRTDVGAPPFFLAPPEAVATPPGPVPPDAIRTALHRLLAAVARPLLANR